MFPIGGGPGGYKKINLLSCFLFEEGSNELPSAADSFLMELEPFLVEEEVWALVVVELKR